MVDMLRRRVSEGDTEATISLRDMTKIVEEFDLLEEQKRELKKQVDDLYQMVSRNVKRVETSAKNEIKLLELLQKKCDEIETLCCAVDECVKSPDSLEALGEVAKNILGKQR